MNIFVPRHLFCVGVYFNIITQRIYKIQITLILLYGVDNKCLFKSMHFYLTSLDINKISLNCSINCIGSTRSYLFSTGKNCVQSISVQKIIKKLFQIHHLIFLILKLYLKYIILIGAVDSSSQSLSQFPQKVNEAIIRSIQDVFEESSI